MIPNAIAVDNGEVFFVSAGNSSDYARVIVTDTDGNFDRQFGNNGTSNGEFYYMHDIAIYDNEIYITDRAGAVSTTNNRVQVFNRDGTFSRTFGSYGTGDGQFDEPLGICVLNDKIYVADSENNRVQIFTPSGTYLDKFGTSGTSSGQMDRPNHMRAIRNHLYIADSQARIQKYDENGNFIQQYTLPQRADGIGLV